MFVGVVLGGRFFYFSRCLNCWKNFFRVVGGVEVIVGTACVVRAGAIVVFDGARSVFFFFF